jgi:hypothetical protein
VVVVVEERSIEPITSHCLQDEDSQHPLKPVAHTIQYISSTSTHWTESAASSRVSKKLLLLHRGIWRSCRFFSIKLIIEELKGDERLNLGRVAIYMCLTKPWYRIR